MEPAHGVPFLMKTAMRREFPTATLILAVLFGAWLAPESRADLSEAQAKASLIYNLTKFVQWPLTPHDKTLNLCVYREDPVMPILAALGDKSSKGLALRIQSVGTADEARKCHVLYIGNDEQASLRSVSRVLRGQSVLIVSDIPDSARTGAIVAIGLENRRIAFLINKAAAEEAGLKLSSQLLKLAKEVYEN